MINFKRIQVLFVLLFLSSTLIYAVFQNSGKNTTSGIESIYSQDVSKAFSFNINAKVYYKEIDAFTVQSLYPTPTLFSADKQSIFAGNLKVNNVLHLPKKLDLQVTAIYLSPDIVPQGKTNGRFTVNVGLKKRNSERKKRVIPQCFRFIQYLGDQTAHTRKWILLYFHQLLRNAIHPTWISLFFLEIE